MKTPLIFLGTALLVVGCSKTDTDYSTTRTEPDYSATNRRVTPPSPDADRYTRSTPPAEAEGTTARRQGTDVTPSQPGTAGTAAADSALTQQIRQAIQSDQTLAAGTKDIQVTMVNGKVTLRGTVNNEETKQSVEQKAKQLAGVTQVDNQIEVKNQ